MNSSANASKEYLKSVVMTASPEQLQLMLLDGAIRFTLRGKEALEKNDIEGAFKGFERAQRIVLELNNGLRRDVNPRLVDQMAALYDFIFRRLIDANVHRETQAADDALRILRHQRETWGLLIEKLAQEASNQTDPQPPVDPGASSDGEDSSFSIEG
ncbi:MAG: flagellar export chaperone FliS [Phycisphaerae bacterium]